MNVLNKVKGLISENPTPVLILIVILLVIIAANYFEYNPLKKKFTSAREDKPVDEFDKLVDSINSKQDGK